MARKRRALAFQAVALAATGAFLVALWLLLVRVWNKRLDPIFPPPLPAEYLLFLPNVLISAAWVSAAYTFVRNWVAHCGASGE
jgi:hypothetical protein